MEHRSSTAPVIPAGRLNLESRSRTTRSSFARTRPPLSCRLDARCRIAPGAEWLNMPPEQKNFLRVLRVRTGFSARKTNSIPNCSKWFDRACDPEQVTRSGRKHLPRPPHRTICLCLPHAACFPPLQRLPHHDSDQRMNRMYTRKPVQWKTVTPEGNAREGSSRRAVPGKIRVKRVCTSVPGRYKHSS